MSGRMRPGPTWPSSSNCTPQPRVPTCSAFVTRSRSSDSLPAGKLSEDLDRVTKALHVHTLGCGVQLLELGQVGPGIIRPLIHIPGDFGQRAIERCEQFRAVWADRFPRACSTLRGSCPPTDQ